MMELVQQGHLAGDNPSEAADDPLERLAAETESLNDELASSEVPVESAAGDEPRPQAERAEPEPDAGKSSQVRNYVVLEESIFEEDEAPYYTVIATVRARNATNALRRAFKEHVHDDEPHKLIAVTATQWRIVPVQRSHRQIESVQIG